MGIIGFIIGIIALVFLLSCPAAYTALMVGMIVFLGLAAVFSFAGALLELPVGIILFFVIFGMSVFVCKVAFSNAEATDKVEANTTADPSPASKN